MNDWNKVQEMKEMLKAQHSVLPSSFRFMFKEPMPLSYYSSGSYVPNKHKENYQPILRPLHQYINGLRNKIQTHRKEWRKIKLSRWGQWEQKSQIKVLENICKVYSPGGTTFDVEFSRYQEEFGIYREKPKEFKAVVSSVYWKNTALLTKLIGNKLPFVLIYARKVGTFSENMMAFKVKTARFVKKTADVTNTDEYLVVGMKAHFGTGPTMIEARNACRKSVAMEVQKCLS